MFTKEKFDELEELASDLRSMTVVTGLCRREKEQLNKAADFITDIIESTGYPITDEDDEE